MKACFIFLIRCAHRAGQLHRFISAGHQHVLPDFRSQGYPGSPSRRWASCIIVSNGRAPEDRFTPPARPPRPSGVLPQGSHGSSTNQKFRTGPPAHGILGTRSTAGPTRVGIVPIRGQTCSLCDSRLWGRVRVRGCGRVRLSIRLVHIMRTRAIGWHVIVSAMDAQGVGP